MGQKGTGVALGLFFLIGGIAFMIPEVTREIWIGQIWVVVGLILLLAFAAPGQLKEKLRSLRQKPEQE
jgi:hypothetical protein